MDNLKFCLILLILLSILLLFRTDKFVNMNMKNILLQGFNNKWLINDVPKLDIKPKKTSELRANCDEKRGVCITY